MATPSSSPSSRQFVLHLGPRDNARLWSLTFEVKRGDLLNVKQLKYIAADALRTQQERRNGVISDEVLRDPKWLEKIDKTAANRVQHFFSTNSARLIEMGVRWSE